MQLRGPENPGSAELRPVFRIHAQLCKALANEHRLAVIYALRDGEKRVSDLAAELGISIHNLSQHLAILKRDGVVSSRKEGQKVFYCVANPKFIQASTLIRQALVEQHRSDDRTLLTADLMDALQAGSTSEDVGQTSGDHGESEDAGGRSQIGLVPDSEAPASPSPFGSGDGSIARSSRME